MKRLLILLVLLSVFLGVPIPEVYAIPPTPLVKLPTTCNNGETVVWNSTTRKWDTCAAFAGGGDMLASVYVGGGLLLNSVGGTGLDSSGSTGTPYVTAGTWSIMNAATARTNLGLAIGTNVQAYDADLTTYAGITPSANIQTFLGSADYAAMRTNMGVQAADDDLTTYAGITPSANIQTLLGSADFSTARTNLGLAIGTDVLAPDGDGSSLTSLSGSAIASGTVPTDYLPANSDSSAGIVASGAAQVSKVWKTDAAGVPGWRDDATAGSPTFNTIGTGTNESATMTVGTGGTLTYSGTGVVNANQFMGVTSVDATEFGYLNGVTSAIQTQISGKQAAAAALTTYAGIAPSANVQTMLGSADNAAILSNIGAQAADADLTTYAGITPSANVQTMLGSANNAAILSNIGAQAASANLTEYATTNPSANGLSLISAVDYAAMKTLMDLDVGSDIQAYNAGLQSIAGVTETAGGMLYSTASNTFSNLALGSSGALLRSNGTAPAWTTTTLPNTVAAGSVLAANTANTLSAVSSTSGTKVLSNTDGTISWASPSGTGDLKADGTIPLTADWDAVHTITSEKFVSSKTTGVAGSSALYEASGTDVNVIGWMGPASIASSWLYQFNSTAPTAGQVMAFGVPAGTGGPDGEAVSTQTWITPALSSGYTDQVTLNSITAGGIAYGSAANTIDSTEAATQYGVVYGGGTGAPGITAAGTNNQVLKASTSAAPAFGSLVAGDLPTVPASKGGTGVANNDANTITFNGGNYSLGLTLGGNTSVTFPTTGTLQTTTGTPANFVIASQAAGDILYASSNSAWSRLGKGTDGQVLTLAAGVPSWTTQGSGPHAFNDTNNTVSGRTTGTFVRATGATTYDWSDYILSGTTGQTYTFPSATTTVVGAGSANTFTGVNDFGGATSLEIPNGASPTVDAAGEIAIDTTSDQIKYYGGAERVIPYKKTFSVVVPSVAATDDMLIMKAPYGMTLTAIDCIVSAATSATINIQECDSAGANCTDTATSDLACDTDGANTTTFNNATVDSGDWLKLDVASISGTPGNLTVTATYSVVGD